MNRRLRFVLASVVTLLLAPTVLIRTVPALRDAWSRLDLSAVGAAWLRARTTLTSVMAGFASRLHVTPALMWMLVGAIALTVAACAWWFARRDDVVALHAEQPGDRRMQVHKLVRAGRTFEAIARETGMAQDAVRMLAARG